MAVSGSAVFAMPRWSAIDDEDDIEDEEDDSEGEDEGVFQAAGGLSVWTARARDRQK